MFHDIIKWCHKLHKVMAGHGGGDSQYAHHSAAPYIFSQRCHFAAKRMKTHNLHWSSREPLKQQVNLSHVTHLVLYRCIMPWTISTEGFPLKKEMWSGSCLEGESGAAHVASLLSWDPSVAPALLASLFVFFCSEETLGSVPPPLSRVNT